MEVRFFFTLFGLLGLIVSHLGLTIDFSLHDLDLSGQIDS